MKIASWNINALRAHESSFRKAMAELQPDIFCLQEIKVREDQQTFPVKGYHSIMNPADMSQFYGTGAFLRNDIRPLSITFDFRMDAYDYQGRLIAIELGNFYVVCSYWPFSAYQKDGYWLKYRIEWCKQLQDFVHELQEKKPIVICGDMNMVHTSADAFDGKAIKKAGCFYPEEHEAFDQLLQDERLVDSYRALHPLLESNGRAGTYSAWAYSKGGEQRNNNEGFRIDYFLVSETLMPKVKSSEVLPDIEGSDHCPIMLEIEET